MELFTKRLLVLLVGFVSGNRLASMCGELVSSLVLVLLLEVLSVLKSMMRKNSLLLVSEGILFGIFVDAFKVGS